MSEDYIQTCNNKNVSLNLVSLELNDPIKRISQITIRSRNPKFRNSKLLSNVKTTTSNYKISKLLHKMIKQKGKFFWYMNLLETDSR